MTDPASPAAAGDPERAHDGGDVPAHGRRAATGRRAARTEVDAPATLGERRAAQVRRRAEASVLPHGSRASFVPCEALVRAATGPTPVSAQESRPAPAPAPAPSRAPAPAPGRAPVATVTTASGAPRATASLPTRVLGAAKKSALVVAAVGLAASTVLPLLGGAGGQSAQADGTVTPWVTSAGQHVTVGAGVAGSDASRDPYGATSLVDLATQSRRNVAAAVDSEYVGPTTADFLADPLYDALDRDQVLAVAMQYLGTPYVHGGEDPSACDCSGLITFVYAQFGIELTHYVPTQDQEGRRIPASEAVPGDLVVFDDLAHDGIYAGNGMILDAPKPGGFVDVRPIWTPAHHFVRIDG